MTKKELKKAIKKSILSGKTKQETYENFKGESQFSYEEIAKIVNLYPTLQAREKYKTLNLILMILLFITILFKVLLGFSFIEENGIKFFPVLFIFPIINIFFLYWAATYNGYGWMAIFIALNYLRSLSDVIGKPIDVSMIFDIVLVVGTVTIMSYLHFKLFPDYRTTVQREEDNNGKIKIIKNYKFED